MNQKIFQEFFTKAENLKTVLNIRDEVQKDAQEIAGLKAP